MPEVLLIILVTWFAGLTAVLGGLIARFERSQNREVIYGLLHGITALGGMVLLTAVAFALVSEGNERLSPRITKVANSRIPVSCYALDSL